MTLPTTNVHFKIALDGKRAGTRQIVMDDLGFVEIVTMQDGFEIRSAPKFTHRDAVLLAHRVMSGHERTVTSSSTLRILAAAVLLLEQQMGSEPMGELEALPDAVPDTAEASAMPEVEPL